MRGWRVKVSHASLNRHDLFTLRGISGHAEGIRYPIILGNDAAGKLRKIPWRRLFVPLER